MSIKRQRHTQGLSFLLIAGFVAAFLSSPTFAHEVLDEHDESVETDAGEIFAPQDIVRALLQLFRETGDDHHLDQAWTRIEPVLRGTAINTDVLIDAALVAQARHEFELALELTNDALALRRDNDQAWLLLSSIHLVRGENPAAGEACGQLRHTPLLVVFTCRARVALAMNEFEREKAQLDKLLTVVNSAWLRDDWWAWSLSIAGDLAVAAEQPEQATQYFTRSLDLAESTQVRAALVDVLIASDSLDKASDILDEGAPALPLVVRRLVVAEKLGKSDEFSKDIENADREFQQWIADKDWLHAREMARFYIDVVDRPMLARRLATINLTLQREPEDFRLAQRTRVNSIVKEIAGT